MKVAQKTMKAVQIENYGGNEVLHVNTEAEVPSVTPGKVLVEVHAASVNPVDCKIRTGMLKQVLHLHFPTTLGGDFSGTIVEVGENVQKFKKGDEVFGFALSQIKGSGTFAEFTLVEANSIALKPKKINDIDASSLPLAGVSALQALIEHMNLKKGQRILILGASGGIGTMAVQLAKHLGAHVTAMATGERMPYVKSLGADEVLDYKKQPLENLPKNFDAILDPIGGETYKKTIPLLKRGGVIVTLLEKVNEALANQHGVKAVTQITQITTDRLMKLIELVNQGVLKVHVDKTFPLDKAAEALAALEEKHPKGKIVLKIK